MTGSAHPHGTPLRLANETFATTDPNSQDNGVWSPVPLLSADAHTNIR